MIDPNSMTAKTFQPQSLKGCSVHMSNARAKDVNADPTHSHSVGSAVRVPRLASASDLQFPAITL